MNPFKDWGVIKFYLKESTISSELHNKKLVAGLLVKEGDYYIPVHLIDSIDDINKLQALYNKYVVPHLLDLYSIRKIPVIEVPSTHNIKEFNKLLPVIHAVLFSVKPEKYVELVKLDKEDLMFVRILYEYFKSSPYYHTPFQSNHYGDFILPFYERILTVLKYFNPATLRFLAYQVGNKKYLIPIILPRHGKVKRVIHPDVYYMLHDFPPVITMNHLKILVGKILEKLKVQSSSVASKFLSFSMFGADLTFYVTNKCRSAILQLNFPRGSSFVSFPVASSLLCSNYTEHAKNTVYNDVVMLHYDEQQSTLYFIHSGSDNVYRVKTDTINVGRGTVLINNEFVLNLENHYYNELIRKYITLKMEK